MYKRKKNDRWTVEELDILREHYGKIGAVGVAAMLPGRTVEAITNKANLVQIKGPNSWTRAEDRTILKNIVCEDRYYTNMASKIHSIMPYRSTGMIALRIEWLIKRNAAKGVYPMNVYIHLTGSLKGYYEFTHKRSVGFMHLVDVAIANIENNYPNRILGKKIAEVIRWKYQLGFDEIDIAEEYGISVESAKWMINTGDKLLKQLLTKK